MKKNETAVFEKFTRQDWRDLTDLACRIVAVSASPNKTHMAQPDYFKKFADGATFKSALPSRFKDMLTDK